MVKTLLQVFAFFLPPPLNIWFHRLAGSKIGKHVKIHLFALILAKSVRINDGAEIKFGTMINIRSLHLGRKSRIGYFNLVKGVSDFHIGDACLTSTMAFFECSRPITLENYACVGPRSILATHGSFLPATEGYPVTFAPITIKSKGWVCMNATIGPGVVVGEGSIVMPGTTLSRSVPPDILVAGDPASLKSVPMSALRREPDNMEDFATELLEEFCNWSNEYKDTDGRVIQSALKVRFKHRHYTISVDDDDADIVLYTENGQKHPGMYFSLADLTTDEKRHPLKTELERFMRMYYGLIFL